MRSIIKNQAWKSQLERKGVCYFEELALPDSRRNMGNGEP
jgi:hypothetical protein